MQPEAHSAEQFGPQRDFWWHHDFLDLMVRRWRLRETTSLVDVGCGQGHWSRLLYPYLKQPAQLIGIDREPRWVAEAERRFRQNFPLVPPDQYHFIEGDAGRIPLPDNSTDIATCQTVLMHLADPRQALREMLRIVRPGGLVICAEPNNLWNFLVFTSLTASEPVESLVQRFEFWLRYHRGMIATGEGDHAIGDLLPGYFAQTGLVEIMVHQTDRAACLFPPYANEEMQALLAQERSAKNASVGPWNFEKVRQLVLAGGGTEEFFERGFTAIVEEFGREQEAIESGNFHAAGGNLFYLVSGRKP